MQCFIFNKPFSFFHGAKLCSVCKLHCCSDCIRRTENMDTCICCLAIQTNLPTFNNLKALQSYSDKFLNSNFSLQSTAIVLLLNLLKAESKYEEHIIFSLYKNRKYYINDSILTLAIQNYLCSYLNQSKNNKILPVLIDLICDISIYNKKSILVLRPDFNYYRHFLNQKCPDLSAATSRLIYILSINHILNPDQESSIELIKVGCRESVAFITGALSTLFATPSLYEDSLSSSLIKCPFDLNNLPQLVNNLLKLLEQRSMNSSIASQYFSSLILLKISESDDGLKELVKHIPMQQVTSVIVRYCPRTLGMKKQKARIAIYLARMIKNVWFYCEKSIDRDKLLSNFYVEISIMILDLNENHIIYDRYSYMCTIQSITIEIADDIMEQNEYREFLINPKFQEKLSLMKEERRTNNENEKSKQIDSLSLI